MGDVVCSPAQIAGYAYQAGFAGPDLVTAVAVALAESAGHTWAIDNDSDGSQDQGLWQINTVHEAAIAGMVVDPGTGSTAVVGASSMFQPAPNAAAAYMVSGGGSNWTPWATYNNGAYQAHLTVAESAAAGVNAPGQITQAGGGGGRLLGSVALDPDGVYPGTVGGSAGAAEPTVGRYLVDDYDRPILAQGANRLPTVALRSQITGLWIAGLGDVSAYLTAGSVELDADQVGQVVFTLQDSKWRMTQHLKLGTRIRYAGLRLILTDLAVAQGGGAGPAWQVTGTVAIAASMKTLWNPPTMPSGVAAGTGDDTLASSTPGASTSVTASVGNNAGSTYDSGVITGLPTAAVGANPSPSTMITPTDYVAFWAKKFGGKLFYGAATYTQSVISPLPVQQGLDPGVFGENLWDLCNRLASNYGFWLFDADGSNLWFGPPGTGPYTIQRTASIVSRSTPFRLGWNGSWGDRAFDAITIPNCEVSNFDRREPVTITAQLPRSRGEQVRPGMAMWLKGVGNFDSDKTGTAYIVTKVTWQMDSGQTPVQVTAVSPINPAPTDPSLLPSPSPNAYGQGNQILNATTQTVLSPDPTVTHLADDFVDYALGQVGEPYVWGDDSPATGFDCSGLVEWAAGRIGIAFPAQGYPGTRSQQQYSQCAATANTITVAQALNIRGALLFEGAGGDQHVAISLGDGSSTVQAENTQAGVVVVPAAGFNFTLGGLVPGADYSNHVQLTPVTVNAQGGVGSTPYGPDPTRKPGSNSLGVGQFNPVASGR